MSIAHTAAAAVPVQPRLTSPLIFLLAASTGLSVAALYYSQPTLGILASDLHASNRAVGWIPTLTQFGYALGLLFLAPLGDRFDRRTIIVVKSLLLAMALLAIAAAPGLDVLLVASLAVGLLATVAQDIVPAAATLAPAEHRGRIVGTVMTGLLLGILLSRVLAGFVAEHFGWRAMFFVAAASIAFIGVAAARGLPRLRPTTHLGYGALLGSLAGLWKRHGALRRAAVAQALLSVGFSAFWSTLAVMLHGAPFHLGSAAAGAFGLAGAAGALAAPIAGRLADRRGPELVIRMGAALVAVSFAAMLFAPLLAAPAARLGLIVVAAIGFDFGLQAALIAHQTVVYGIDPGARSRLNAVFFTGVFVGMATGSALGALVLAQWGWSGVAAMASVSALGALAVRMWPAGSKKKAAVACGSAA